MLANVATVRKARKALLKAAPDFVSDLITASKNEARMGKSDTARWAILHTHTLQPIATPGNNSTPNSGVTINVGVKVSGTAKAEE